MKHRDSLAPQGVHKCKAMPDQFLPNSRSLDAKVDGPDMLFFPTKPCRIILHSDSVWYMVVEEDFKIPITHCPFCGEKLGSSTEKPLPSPPPVKVEEEVPDDDEPEIEIETGEEDSSFDEIEIDAD